MWTQKFDFVPNSVAKLHKFALVRDLSAVAISAVNLEVPYIYEFFHVLLSFVTLHF